ncbi:hypothetical protein [Allonocardiopsis opalescens]|uniref:DUF3558 domain-containing protein n=1 Tax=Allonocardiopsis opalescens TaxID=1144618 RepID=A0A2T0PVD2_9ACTN|nr:hypothetical protein [Allonocardiopsis opalescens]PRX95489.1 hypothetical protein CLV72_10997 [Allonocardiopsis opalescens]
MRTRRIGTSIAAASALLLGGCQGQELEAAEPGAGAETGALTTEVDGRPLLTNAPDACALVPPDLVSDALGATAEGAPREPRETVGPYSGCTWSVGGAPQAPPSGGAAAEPGATRTLHVEIHVYEPQDGIEYGALAASDDLERLNLSHYFGRPVDGLGEGAYFTDAHPFEFGGVGSLRTLWANTVVEVSLGGALPPDAEGRIEQAMEPEQMEAASVEIAQAVLDGMPT